MIIIVYFNMKKFPYVAYSYYYNEYIFIIGWGSMPNFIGISLIDCKYNQYQLYDLNEI